MIDLITIVEEWIKKEGFWSSWTSSDALKIAKTDRKPR